jgi:hypothetical protein
VKVTLTNEATGITNDTLTSDSGDYVFPAVPVGTYSLDFDLTGFKKSVRHGVSLDINQVVTLNMEMQIGQTKEVVEVTSEAPLVDTTSTQLGTVVNDRSIVGLPLNQRDTYQFLSLQPGVQSQVGADLYVGSSTAGSVSVNGGRGRANNFSVNGGDANDMFANLPTVQPSPDTVEEFRILTNTFDAEYGRNSGSVVNVVTKSGTNQLHGNVYEFIRNKALNAQGFFDTTKAAFIQNQFGGTIGGPIKKDRTFFFASYEGRRVRQGQSGDQVTVPTAAERVGDFSDGTSATDLSSGLNFAGQISDQFVADVLNSRPGCTAAVQAQNPGAVIAADAFYGAHHQDPNDDSSPIVPGIFTDTVNGVDNKIPVECQDPVAVDLMQKYVPGSNAAGGIFQAVLTSRDRQDQMTFRFDHRINNKQNFSAYYYLTDDDTFNPFNNFQAAGANVPGFGGSIKQRFQQYNLSHTWTISNSLVNELHFTYMREAQRTYGHSEHTDLVTNSCSSAVAAFCFTGLSDSSAVNGLGADRLGIRPGLGPDHEGVPDISVSGGFTIGNNFEGELPQVGNSFQWSDNLTMIRGNHTYKFGGDIRRMRFDQTLFFEVNGYMQYFGGGPDDPIFASNLYPNYLLGLVDQYQQGAAQVENVRTTAVYLFGQDSWKIRPNLTLNYGLRWELNTPLTDIGHHVQTFRPGQTTTTYPCELSAYGQSLLGTSDCSSAFPTGLVVPGDKGIPGGLTETYYKSFAPRIGIAWSPGGSGKTSIRAGWGMFYNPIEQLVLEQFSAEPPFGGSNLVFNTLFNTPFVSQGGFPIPNPFNPAGGEFSGIQRPTPGDPVDWSIFRPILLFGEFPQKMRSQYSEQYNLTIQRELTKDMVLQLSYVGSQGHRLLATNDLNAGNPQTCLDLHNISVNSGNSDIDCDIFFEDSPFVIPAGTIPAGMTLHLPYGSTPSVTGPNANDITLVGLRPFSSPNCDPLTGTGCPPDGIPVFTNIFQQGTIANSSYNSFQANLEKRFSHGLQLQAAYTFSKSMDMASSFEDIINPFDPAKSRSLSLFDARHRLVLSYYYDLPVPKYSGLKGKVLNGWAVSGITQFQAGFPIHIQSFNDTELTGSIDFSAAGTPDILGPFHTNDPHHVGCALGTGGSTGVGCEPVANQQFDPNQFADAELGNFGTAKRTLCCGPGLNNTDLSIQKTTPIGESNRLEFRWDIFNVANHPKFFNPDGNITDGSDFGHILQAGQPRLMQFALKFYF